MSAGTSRRILLHSHFGHTVQEYVHIDAMNPDNLVTETVQDMEPIIERAKYLSELEPGKDFRHAAIIPQIVYEKAYREGWLHDKERWKRWANDPDNRAFRTWPGHL